MNLDKKKPLSIEELKKLYFPKDYDIEQFTKMSPKQQAEHLFGKNLEITILKKVGLWNRHE